MKHTIQIHELCNVTKYGVEYITKVIDATTSKELSSCQTSFDNSNEMFAAVESGNVKNEDKIYKQFEAETEKEIKDFIYNLAYDDSIEKKLMDIDFEEG